MKIQIVGPVCGTGYGVTVANLTREFVRVGEDVRLLGMGPIDTEWFVPAVELACEEAWEAQQEAKDLPDVTLCIWHEWDHPPKSMDRFTKLMNMERYVALPTFELDRVKPQAVEALSKCFRVVVSSNHAFNVLYKEGLRNIRKIVHHGVDLEIFHETVNPEFVFGDTNRPFMISNVGKFEKRKGHDLCVRLLAYLMSKNINARLWALWANPFLMDTGDRVFELVKSAAAEFKVGTDALNERLVRVQPRKDPIDLQMVIGACPVAVYPFRAEGWNLPLLEALACERRVVATDVTGPMEYLDESNALMINKFERVPAVDGIWFGPGKAEGCWYEPSFDQLTAHVENLYQLWLEGRLTPNVDGRRTAEDYSWTNASRRLRTWLLSGCE
jgi:glycosyltransferase involved in cell wall biosynthesis